MQLRRMKRPTTYSWIGCGSASAAGAFTDYSAHEPKHSPAEPLNGFAAILVLMLCFDQLPGNSITVLSITKWKSLPRLQDAQDVLDVTQLLGVSENRIENECQNEWQVPAYDQSPMKPSKKPARRKHCKQMRALRFN